MYSLTDFFKQTSKSNFYGANGESRTHMKITLQWLLRPSRIPFRHIRINGCAGGSRTHYNLQGYEPCEPPLLDPRYKTGCYKLLVLYPTELPTACGRQDWIRTNDTKFPKFKSKLLYASFLNFNRNALRFRALPLSYISYLSKIWLDSNQQPLLNRQFVINYFAVCIPY